MKQIQGVNYVNGQDPVSVILETEAEAENVLEQLRARFGQYKFSTVSDLQSLVGLPSRFADEYWGWTDLTSTRISPVSGGYLLELPPVKSLV